MSWTPKWPFRNPEIIVSDSETIVLDSDMVVSQSKMTVLDSKIAVSNPKQVFCLNWERSSVQILTYSNETSMNEILISKYSPNDICPYSQFVDGSNFAITFNFFVCGSLIC